MNMADQKIAREHAYYHPYEQVPEYNVNTSLYIFHHLVLCFCTTVKKTSFFLLGIDHDCH